MLQAGRLVSCAAQPLCLRSKMLDTTRFYALVKYMPALCAQHSTMQNTTVLDDRDSGIKKKRKRKVTAIVSAEGDNSFKELKGRIISLKARELNILTGNLDKEPNNNKNPAKILNIRLTCDKCGKQFTSKKWFDKHLTKICSTSKNKVGDSTPVKDKLCQNDKFVTINKDKIFDNTNVELHKNNNINAPKLSPELDINEQPEKKLASSVNNSENKDLKNILRDSKRKLVCSRNEQNMCSTVIYFDVMVNMGKLDDAYEHFKRLRYDQSQRDVVETIEVYNVLLRGFARRSQFSRVQELWHSLLSRGLQPNLDSYISSMIALSRSDPSKNIYKTIFRQVYNEFLGKGFTLENALDHGRFGVGDRKLFLRALDYFGEVERARVRFEDVAYSTPLLDSLPATSARLESQLKDIMDRDQLDHLVQRQTQAELHMKMKIPSIVKDRFAVPPSVKTFIDDLESEWRTHLLTTLNRRNKEYGVNMSKSSKMSLGFIYSSLPVSALADILLSAAAEMCKESATFSDCSSIFIRKLGEETMRAYFFHKKCDPDTHFLEDLSRVYSSYLDWYMHPAGGQRNHRAAIQEACGDFRFEESDYYWTEDVICWVGRVLRDTLLKEFTLTRDKNGEIVVGNKILANGRLQAPAGPVSSNPAFFKVFRMRKEGKQLEEMKPHPSLSKLYSPIIMLELEFRTEELPMVCPPLPWLSPKTGAFLLSSPDLVRIFGSLVSDQDKKLEDLPFGRIHPVLDSVNQLSAVPWTVNKAVLNLAKKVFLETPDFSLCQQLSLPLHPDDIPPPPEPNSNIQVGKELYQQYHMDKLAHEQIKRESYSLWCDTVYRLSIAQHFEEDVLWFPHSMDFRGRVYPAPPYFNHMGADLARSLLVFARGKPLGPTGLNWLKLHCVNLTGLKKRESVEERLEYAEQIMELILDSANNPLGGKRWFLESDEPWQTFSACLEIRNALNHPEGPEHYVCHLPIHQDGSCNGLQHYAALGRDKLGAVAVNLVPSAKPQDVYSEIATIVERKRREDAEDGLEVAKLLQGFVKRKVIKQTVMTTVYGVTQYGASKQIARQLKDISDYPVEFVEKGSKYLGIKTFESLNELFTASQDIQDWLTECARAISGECDMNVEWTTPLGLPVVQPYTKLLNDRTKLYSAQEFDVKLYSKLQKEDKPKTIKVMTVKHRNGFPPNFIHSLDSCHMMLTSLYLWNSGITFASVHDCYWTHACDVELMNRTCREQFVSLHSFPILENLSQSFLDQFVDTPVPARLRDKEEAFSRKFPNTLSPRELERRKREMLFKMVPKKGDLDLNVVKDSVYFFS